FWRIEQRHELAAFDCQHQMRAGEGPAQRLGPRSAGHVPTGDVLDPDADLHQAIIEALARHLDRPGQRPELPDDASRTIRAGNRLDFPPARELEADRALTIQVRAELHLALQAFVPGGPQPAAGVQGRDGAKPGGAGRLLDRPSLQLEEPHLPAQPAGAGRFDQALGLAPGVLAASALAPCARRQHAELPAHLVLRRRRAVRIEDVPFVEHCIRDLPRALEAHCSVSPASLRSETMSWSQLATARRALQRSRRFRVSVCSRSQPELGKYRSIISRQTRTGSRNDASLSQGIWLTLIPVRP